MYKRRIFPCKDISDRYGLNPFKLISRNLRNNSMFNTNYYSSHLWNLITILTIYTRSLLCSLKYTVLGTKCLVLWCRVSPLQEKGSSVSYILVEVRDINRSTLYNATLFNDLKRKSDDLLRRHKDTRSRGTFWENLLQLGNGIS